MKPLQVAMDKGAPFLPQEIITYILKFLAVKSLIRCVCKHWKNLIKTPSFMTAHLYHSSQHRPCRLFEHYHSPNLQLYLLDCERQIFEVQNIPLADGDLKIVGSSNGMLCLRIDQYGDRVSPFASLLLWNPAIREVREVLTTFPHLTIVYFVGFGFSPIVNDYKIVILHYCNHVHRVEVYSLSIGAWKKMEVGNGATLGATLHLFIPFLLETTKVVSLNCGSWKGVGMDLVRDGVGLRNILAATIQA